MSIAVNVPEGLGVVEILEVDGAGHVGVAVGVIPIGGRGT